MRIAGLLLAAGAGRRMGGPKALISVGGVLLADHALGALAAGGCTPLVAVLGAQAGAVREGADLAETTVVVNDDWPEGIGSSLRTGLAAVRDAAPDVAACVVTLVDNPGVTGDAVRRISSAARPGRAAVATYAGRRGHPVALGRSLWAAIAREARGDIGARGLLGAHPELVDAVPCDDVASPEDLDSPAALADYRRAFTAE